MHTILNQCLSVKGRSWICVKLLMAVLVGQGLKQTWLGKCVLKAMKSNSVIPPLLFGLSVEIDHGTVCYCRKFQSWDMLSSMIKSSDQAM